jgi:HK97 family phage portal protein
MDKAEADKLKAQWMASHAGPVPTPAVLSGGVTYETNSVDPERSQLVQTREAGVATAARILGIPAPLLLVNMNGSNVTYANVSQLFTEFLRSTVVPLYVTPMEAAFSTLVGRREAVRFDINELVRVDIESRYRIYQAAVGMGVMDARGIQRIEGLRPPEDAPTIFAPVLPTDPTTPEPEETPA